MTRTDGPDGRWWTLATFNFVHMELWHFWSNMLGLLWDGLFCAGVGGFGGLEMLGLTILACIGSNVGMLLHL